MSAPQFTGRRVALLVGLSALFGFALAQLLGSAGLLAQHWDELALLAGFFVLWAAALRLETP